MRSILHLRSSVAGKAIALSAAVVVVGGGIAAASEGGLLLASEETEDEVEEAVLDDTLDDAEDACDPGDSGSTGGGDATGDDADADLEQTVSTEDDAVIDGCGDDTSGDDAANDTPADEEGDDSPADEPSLQVCDDPADDGEVAEGTDEDDELTAQSEDGSDLCDLEDGDDSDGAERSETAKRVHQALSGSADIGPGDPRFGCLVSNRARAMGGLGGIVSQAARGVEGWDADLEVDPAIAAACGIDAPGDEEPVAELPAPEDQVSEESVAPATTQSGPGNSANAPGRNGEAEKAVTGNGRGNGNTGSNAGGNGRGNGRGNG